MWSAVKSISNWTKFYPAISLWVLMVVRTCSCSSSSWHLDCCVMTLTRIIKGKCGQRFSHYIFRVSLVLVSRMLTKPIFYTERGTTPYYTGVITRFMLNCSTWENTTNIQVCSNCKCIHSPKWSEWKFVQLISNYHPQIIYLRKVCRSSNTISEITNYYFFLYINLNSN